MSRAPSTWRFLETMPLYPLRTPIPRGAILCLSRGLRLSCDCDLPRLHADPSARRSLWVSAGARALSWR